MDDLIVLMV